MADCSRVCRRCTPCALATGAAHGATVTGSAWPRTCCRRKRFNWPSQDDSNCVLLLPVLDTAPWLRMASSGLGRGDWRVVGVVAMGWVNLRGWGRTA